MAGVEMQVVVWVLEDTWDATVAAAAAVAPADAEIELLYVLPAEPPLQAISEEDAEALLKEASSRLGRLATTELRRGRVEREVVAAAADADLLVMARDGDPSRLGPRSIGPLARFVLDHAPCQVLLVWPDEPPPASTIPGPPGR